MVRWGIYKQPTILVLIKFEKKKSSRYNEILSAFVSRTLKIVLFPIFLEIRKQVIEAYPGFGVRKNFNLIKTII